MKSEDKELSRLLSRRHTCALQGWRFIVVFGLMLICGSTCVQTAFGGIIQDYPLSSFTLTNTNGDGTAQAGPGTIVLTGPNNGSGDPGRTDLTTTATATGLIQFQFSYSTLDTWVAFDYAAYLVVSDFFLLADQNGVSGTASFAVTAGQMFGFRVASLDNFGEPGILSISNVAEGGNGVPEPGTLFLFATGCVAVAGFRMSAAVRTKQKQI